MRLFYRPGRLLLFLLVGYLLVTATIATAQEDDDFPPQGLIAEYTQGALKATRVDDSIGFRWKQSAPDLRLPAGDFSARWRGSLSVFDEGAYRLYAHVEGGRLQISLDGQQVLQAKAKKPQWVGSKPLQLRFKDYPLEVNFKRNEAAARLTLFWSGPGFPIEPLPASYLTHDEDAAPGDAFERGRQLARGLRCTACHDSAVEPPAALAPSLSRAGGNIHTDWLVKWLRDKPQHGFDGSRRMPGFQLSGADAAAIAAVLNATPSQDVSPADGKKGRVESGGKLFRTLGCVACHDTGDKQELGLWSGSDLSQLSAKRPAGFIEKWLEDPSALNSQHRMPVFDLTSQQRVDLAAYLTRNAAPKAAVVKQKQDEKTLERGRKLLVSNGCFNCHQALDGLKDAAHAAKKPARLNARSNWQASCVRQPQNDQPHYRLAADDVEALKAYYSQLPSTASPGKEISLKQQEANRPEPTGAQLMVEMNCVACHQRGDFTGLGARLPELAVAHPELASLLPALKPPALNSVGDKLNNDALTQAIRRQGKPVRPWLRVKMPRFRMSDNDLSAIGSHLIARDRVPLEAKDQPLAFEEQVVKKSGARLLTSAGFGCVSCHAIGKSAPSADVIAGRGPQLAGLDARVRKVWFDRWVRNPARITPRMEMPSIQSPVHGVLDGQLQTQLDALWTTLNSKNLKLPKLGAVRVVKRSEAPAASARQQRAAVLTDVLHHNNGVYVKPFIIGLKNGHSVLLDLEHASLSGWWHGDVARQLTEGKTWYWEPAGDSPLPAGETRSDLQLRIGESYVAPILQGQFKTQFDMYQHIPDGGIELHHRLAFPGEKQRQVRATQTVTPTGAGSRSGFRRVVQFAGLNPAQQVRFFPLGSVKAVSLAVSQDGRTAKAGRDGQVQITIETDAFKFVRVADDLAIESKADRAGRLEIALRYELELPKAGPTLPLAGTTSPPAPKPLELQVVPGFKVMKLPLAPPGEWMPTGLAWSPAGQLAVSSLKGRVWLADDLNADGIEDRLTTFSDELAAPYGLAFPEQAMGRRSVDVINKYALLRLVDVDGDGVADKVFNLASGWGHTADYHDWVVGLPSDGAGGYLVAAACQQDDRSQAAARLRGEVLRLTPTQAKVMTSGDAPSRYSVHSVSKGHRFPMGIARSQNGAVFVTDNQGNFNPFNELNHVIQGARYGFINKIDRAKFGSKTPGFLPPAINIPHPWTRSVNGLCFLETPAPIKAKKGELFGPFEGHLIGCEYDTRRLIRMSVQKVGDTYQGAAYPFSLDNPKAGQALLGPLVAAVSPAGELYVGGIRDSGWGGGNNIGEIVKITPSTQIPPGIAEVHSDATGIRIEFTRKIQGDWVTQAATYAVTSYRRDSTPAYGGSDKDRKPVKVSGVKRLTDAEGVALQLPELKPGYVYEIKIRTPEMKQAFFPAEAYFTFYRSPVP